MSDVQPPVVNIFLTIPSFARHGGIRVILEWANRLSQRHQVYLRLLKGSPLLDWFALNPKVKVVTNDHFLTACDLILVTSPHSVNYLSVKTPARKIIFLQMLEDLFQPKNLHWKQQCEQLYRAPYPLITISTWGIQQLRDLYQRRDPTYFVGNGVNLDDFPIVPCPKDGHSVLVEGWISSNNSKDPQNVAPAVAAFLQSMGYRILAYAAQPNSGPFHHIPHEFFCKPSIQQLNSLYSRATILLKASQWDFRACAPMEAMTKGTVTARALRLGDDDLINEVNCLRCSYDRQALQNQALRLLNDKPLYNRLSNACINYVSLYTWDHWFSIIEPILALNADEHRNSKCNLLRA